MIIGYDLGSARMGCARLADHLPVDLLAEPVTLGVDVDDLDTLVAVAVELAVGGGATRAAIEHGAKMFVPQLVIPPGSTERQIAKAIEAHRRAMISIAEAHEICSRIQDKLHAALEAEGIETKTWARQSWAHRVRPHHQGGITTAQANEALLALCAPGVWERLRDQHQRDATGVGCMWLVDPPAPLKRYRAPRLRPTPTDAQTKPKLSPEAYLAKRLTAAREGMRRLRGDVGEQERIAAGCVCCGKHKLGCPVGDRLREERTRTRVADAIKKGPYLR